MGVSFTATIDSEPAQTSAGNVFRDWKLDDVNEDLELDDTGDAAALTSTSAIVSDLKSRFQTFLGEFYRDLTIGFDWFGAVLGQKLDEGLVRTKVEAEALACPGVVSVDSVSATVTDTKIRQVTITFTATTDVGAVITAVLTAQQGAT